MHIAVVGLSHKTAPVEIREKLSIPETAIEQAIKHILSYPHVEEVAILSTCNRLEIYLVATELDSGVREVIQFLSERSRVSLGALRPYLFTLLRQDAGMHMMRVSAGLDSLILGEGQILSQVKAMHQLSQQYKGVGRILGRLLKQAVTAGKRVRTETSIGTGAVSISSAAVELAQMKVADRGRQSLGSGSLADYRVVILGAGKMSRLLVQHLVSKGATSIEILNRSLPRAQELTQQYASPGVTITAGLLTEMMTAIATADIVFTSTSATEPLLNKANLSEALGQTGGQTGGDRNLMLFDISVPRNVDSDAKELSFVQAYNVDDLKAVVAQNQETRRKMAQEAQGILDQEAGDFDNWWHSLETVPTINSLRDKIETIRTQEMEKALSRLGSEFGGKHQEIIEALTKGIVNKILHDPMVQLRSQQDVGDRRRSMDTLKMLFNLEEAAGTRQ
jgi:glutamyl-tRNA reductase